MRTTPRAAAATSTGELLAVILALVLVASPSAQVRAGLRPEHQDELLELQPSIDDAIDKGVQWLLTHQARDGSWGFEESEFKTGQTALATYTLMKCGLPPTHAAVRRGLEFVLHHEPRMVYAAGAQILALTTAGQPQHLERAELVARQILQWQNGSWSYPNDDGRIGRLHRDRDLSITQFALLGLRTAARAGMRVSNRAVQEAVDETFRYQERPRRAAGKRRDRDELAGFRYKFVTRDKVTGSMTTAGIATLLLAREVLDKKVGRKRGKEIDAAVQRGMRWLDVNWTVEKNPNGDDAWRYYYLYGVERVGALLGTEYVGEHPWYLEGARHLVGKQDKDGSWRARDKEPDTCFALLFLKRATAPTTGQKSRGKPVHTNEDAAAAVGMRIAGGTDGSPADLWVTRLGRAATPADADGAADDGPVRAVESAGPAYVVRVEYLVDGEVVATVGGDPRRAWASDAYLATHRFRRRGKYRIASRVHVVRAAHATADEAAAASVEVLESAPYDLNVEHVLEPWMLPAARRAARNPLLAVEPTVTASSVQGNHPATNACDGREQTVWLAKADDAEPTWTLSLRKAVRAGAIVLGQADTRLGEIGQRDRIVRVRLTINRSKEPLEVDLAADPFEPTVVELGKSTRIKQLEVRVLARKRGSKQGGICGFSEIAFERR